MVKLGSFVFVRVLNCKEKITSSVFVDAYLELN